VDDESGTCLLGNLLSRTASTARVLDSSDAVQIIAALIAETALPCPVFFSRLPATLATAPRVLLPDETNHRHPYFQVKLSAPEAPEAYSISTLASILQACTMARQHRSVHLVPGLNENVRVAMRHAESLLNYFFSLGIKPDLQEALKIVQAYYLQQVRNRSESRRFSVLLSALIFRCRSCRGRLFLGRPMFF
jgi:hypothetical protein